jgi:uncharacterized membrane protein
MASLYSKIKNIRTKSFFTPMLLLLLLTDIVILFNIHGFREILPTIYFTIVPGLLITILMNLNKLEFVKKFVFWIGLSLFIIIFTGLGLNYLYPFISEPLSLFPLFVTFNIIIILLSIIAYHKNQEEFKIQKIFNFKVDTNNKLISPMIFSTIFPFLAFFGTYLMNITNNNSILLLLLFLIPIYFVVIIGLRNKISNSTYPFAILMVSLSFFLMHGLTSNYLIGRDNHLEFFYFQYTLHNYHLDTNIFNTPLNNCLSVNILPTIYSVLTSIKGIYVFKILFGFIGSIIPLIIYVISRKIVGNKYAIFVALLVLFQMNFIELLSLIRQEFALIFFFLAVLVIFDSDLSNINKKILFIIFMFSVIVSHYSTAFIGLAMTVPIILIPFIKKVFNDKKIRPINFDILAFLGLFSYIWYFIVAKSQSRTATRAFRISTGSSANTSNITNSSSSINATNVTNVTNTTNPIVVNHTRENTIPAIFGIGVDSVPQMISVLVNDAIFLTIGIGLMATLWEYFASFVGYKKYKKKLPFEFILGSVISAVLLALFIVIPFFSKAYGAHRIFLTSLVFLGPMFVIGVIKIAKLIGKPKLDLVLLTILIISLFTVSIHFNYLASGIPSSIYYDENSNARTEAFIYDQDVAGAKFLSHYGEKRKIRIHGDTVAGFRLMAANNFSIPNRTFIDSKKTFKFKKRLKTDSRFKYQYLYLTYLNTQKNIIFEQTAPTFITNTTSSNIFLKEWKSRIYDNGGSKVLIP